MFGLTSRERSLKTADSRAFCQRFPARILIAAPAMPVSVTTEMAACAIISIFAVRVSGNVSVRLNAKLVVKAMNR